MVSWVAGLCGLDPLDAYQLVTQAVESIFPDDPPMFLARTPHGYHDVARIQADADRNIKVKSDRQTGVLQNRKLPRKRREHDLLGHPAINKNKAQREKL